MVTSYATSDKLSPCCLCDACCSRHGSQPLPTPLLHEHRWRLYLSCLLKLQEKKAGENLLWKKSQRPSHLLVWEACMKGTCRGRKRRGLQGENKGLSLLEKIVNYKTKKKRKSGRGRQTGIFIGILLLRKVSYITRKAYNTGHHSAVLEGKS